MVDGNAVVPSTRPHGGGGCSHQHAAQVHDGTVIKLLLIAFKTKKKTASMRGRQMRQRDAGRMVLVSSAPKEKLHPSKKQLQVWVRHQAEGRCHSRPPNVVSS